MKKLILTTVVLLSIGCVPIPKPFIKTVTVEIEYCPSGDCMPHSGYVGWASWNGKDEYKIRFKDVKALGHELEHILDWHGVWYNPDKY